MASFTEPLTQEDISRMYRTLHDIGLNGFDTYSEDAGLTCPDPFERIGLELGFAVEGA